MNNEIFKTLTPDTQLTLKQFVEIFNNTNFENKFWDYYYVETYDDGYSFRLVPRNYCIIK